MYQILLLDDEQLALQSVQVLVPWNQLDVSRVLTADDVDYAKELLDKFKIDLVICDIEMPKTNGIEFGEIAMQLGYASFSHFSKVFKDNTGKTPASFRQEHPRIP